MERPDKVRATLKACRLRDRVDLVPRVDEHLLGLGQPMIQQVEVRRRHHDALEEPREVIRTQAHGFRDILHGERFCIVAADVGNGPPDGFLGWCLLLQRLLCQLAENAVEIARELELTAIPRLEPLQDIIDQRLDTSAEERAHMARAIRLVDAFQQGSHLASVEVEPLDPRSPL